MQDNHRYAAIPPAEHNFESVYMLEAGSKEVFDGPDGLWEEVKRWRWIVEVVLIIVMIELLIEGRWSKLVHHDHRYELGGDLTGFAPHCIHPHTKQLILADELHSPPTNRYVQAEPNIRS